MAALFTPRSNSHLIIVIGILVLVPVIFVFGLWVWVRTPWITGEAFPDEQPIEFDHRHHVKDDAIDCLYCHHEAEKSQHAGIPSTSLCMGCHSQIWNDSPQLERLRRSYFSAEPIGWLAVHDLPDFVYFNHAIHLDKGIGCSTCHGRVDQMPRVYQAKPLTMGWCIDCHREPEPHLRPRHRITEMDWEPLPRAEQDALAQQYQVRSKTHCTTCHR